MVKANGVDLCTEAFGDRRNAAMLLIVGAGASMIGWDDELCRQLADGGRYVIRYDPRDTGRSTAYEPRQPPYNLEDLARDALGVLDAYGIERAHLVGASSGGMVAQLAALQAPRRVLSLSLLISTSEVPEAAHAAAARGRADTALPGPTPALLDVLRANANVDWTDEAAAADGYAREWKVLAGSKYPEDEARIRNFARREVRRARNMLSLRFNQPIAETLTPNWRHRLSELRVPTLVIGGSEDPILPLPHSVALAERIPGARLITIDGMGHQVPPTVYPIVIPALLSHTAAAH